LESTSAARLLQCCLEGAPWSDELLRDALNEEDGRAFFRLVVERLADLFEPRLCDEYARLFCRVIELARPALNAAQLLNRYESIRRARHCGHDPKRVFVLSRVTLGADVAVTSIVLDAAKKRFPTADIYLVGSRKNWELFANDERILLHEFAYPRHGTIFERLRNWPELDFADGIVIDPDSRLSQLGLLPLCSDERYYFFESRAYGGDSDATLVELTKRWVSEIFDVQDARAFTAPRLSTAAGPCDLSPDIAVSFGVGDNAEKRLEDPFEEHLIRALARDGRSVLIDEGAGGGESQRVRRICDRIPEARSWRGAYAPFAYAISRAKLYVGYDSAGQHVAAACGTPLVSIFAGYPAERMFQRWRPDGPGLREVVKVTDRSSVPDLVIALANRCAERLT
jgi:ADP-heptose:LPS heptosyltransferase